MEREGTDASLHRRLTSVLLRGAQAQEDSRAIIAQHVEVDERVVATLAAVRRGRAQRARDRDVRIQTDR
jgi:hypothetical protein